MKSVSFRICFTMFYKAFKEKKLMYFFLASRNLNVRIERQRKTFCKGATKTLYDKTNTRYIIIHVNKFVASLFKVMLHGTILTQHCCVKNRRRVTWRAGRFLTQHFVAATCCSNLRSIQIAATLLSERCRSWFV